MDFTELNAALRPAGYEVRCPSYTVMLLGINYQPKLGIHDLETGERVAQADTDKDILRFLAERCCFGRLGRKLGLRGGPPG